ncbi:hypothetical protein Bca101_004005 [Brassica carinata]
MMGSLDTTEDEALKLMKRRKMREQAKYTKKQLQTPKEGIDIDLNAESLDLNETKPAPVAATDTAAASEEYTCWSMELGTIDPAQFASLGKRIDEDEEDYDEEG